MAVYTEVSDKELSAFLTQYSVGGLVRKTPIAEGVENTNYRLETDGGAYILTLFEKRTKAEDLPFFMGLTAHLSGAGLPVAAPVERKDGALIGRLAGRPAVLIEFLPGRPVMEPQGEHCAALGARLADLHNAVAGFRMSRENTFALDGWRALAASCGADADRCAPGLAALIADELDALGAAWPQDLPAGVVHTDLFPDNVLFHEERIAGIIDFYFSCTDFFAYDLAICVNAWCFDDNRMLIAENAGKLAAAYLEKRNVSEAERRAFPTLLRGAALRFLLTRLYDWLNQVDGAIVTVKDPLEFRDILLFHRERYAPEHYGFTDA